MQNEQLIKMANQIGDFYESFPDKKQAQMDIAGHLNKFWAISMRQQIAQYVKDNAGNAAASGLHALVAAAISKHVEI